MDGGYVCAARCQGGVGVEETYRLIDLYIQECEKTSSTEEVKVLQYNMLLDFTDRVAQVKAPRIASEEIYACMQYIQNHTNCQIGIDDVAGFLGKSRTYDIAPFLEEKNELVFTVAGGWAVGIFGLNRSNKLGADRLALKALVQIEYDDGRKDEIKTDESWLVTADGPVRDVSFYNGEIFDATKTLSKAIFENAEKEKPRISPRLVASYGKFAKIIETLEPKEIQKSQNGYIYDFGQNCAGVLELEIKGRKGQRITARHAEVLLNGELFTKPLRSAKAKLEYVCGGEEETYCPKLNCPSLCGQYKNTPM